MPNQYRSGNYNELGGALLAFVILGYVSSALFVIIGIYMLAQYMPYVSLLGGFYTFLILFVVAYCVMIAVFGILLNLKIHRRDKGFFRFYQTICIVQAVLLVLAFFFSLSYGVFSGTRFFNGILSIVYMLAWNYYFLQSQRVRVYFGGDEYIRRAIVGKQLVGSASFSGFGSSPSWNGTAGTSSFCTGCGKPLAADTMFCTNCGKKK